MNQPSPMEPALAATGETPEVADAQANAVQAASDSPQHRLQDVLPEIRELAQKVGGYKQLAELVETLAARSEGS
jgi:hypothetical protein